MTRYWVNPWEESISVPIEDIVDLTNLNEEHSKIAKVSLLDLFKEYCGKLDAYVLFLNGRYSVGVRYGDEGYKYVSLPADQNKIEKYLKELKQ